MNRPMSRYSSSLHDIDPSGETLKRDEGAVKAMYEAAPYPDLGANLKDMSLYINPVLADLESRAQVRFLDVGCGTGHYVVGVAKQHPKWRCYGVDLSGPTIAIARQLAEMHGARVEYHQGTYLEPLPFEPGFDVICALGTIHHTADPVAAMKAIRGILRDDGYLFLHLYGWRADREKFDIKEALSILEPDLMNHRRRFELYDALMRHRRRRWLKRLLTTSPYDAYVLARNYSRNLWRRIRGISWSPPWWARYDAPTAPWIDHFCNPCERAYEVPEVKALLEASGFKVVHMLHHGRVFPQLIPPEWKAAHDALDDWAKWRMSELLVTGGGSFGMILKKA